MILDMTKKNVIRNLANKMKFFPKAVTISRNFSENPPP